MLDHKLIPPELWLEIFDWATFNPNLISSTTPFVPIPGRCVDKNLQVRVALSQVCRTWNAWAARSLYKDIKIRHGAHALQLALRKPTSRYGEMVRRVVLPYQSTVTGPYSSRPLHSIEILQLCTHIHTLHRPLHPISDGLQFVYETEGLTMPSLRRLEWWYYNEAERSGGINSLGSVLRGTPQLRYLFIGGVVGGHHICMDPGPIILADLETIRLHIRSGVLLRQIVTRWTLPSLTRIVLDSPLVKDGSHEIIWEAFGDQLKVIEFGKNVRFLMSDFLSPCLRNCPNLNQLDYYVFFTSPLESTLRHTNLSMVGLHAHVNGLLVEGGSAWNLVEHHFDILCGPNFPALKEIIMYGNWRPILHHHRFSGVKEKLRDGNKVLRVGNQTGIMEQNVGYERKMNI